MSITAIADIGIAVVAAFTLIDAVVTASLDMAIGITAVTRDAITVIAIIKAVLHHVVATNSDKTGVKTGIGIDLIAVIAALITFDTRLQINADDAVAATRRFTAVGASILVDSIAVITGFVPIKPMTITATR